MKTETPRTAAVEFDDTFLRLGRRDVLRGVSFHVSSGETAVILGRSGAGRSRTSPLARSFTISS